MAHPSGTNLQLAAETCEFSQDQSLKNVYVKHRTGHKAYICLSRQSVQQGMGHRLAVLGQRLPSRLYLCKRCGRSFGCEGLQPVPCGVVDISDSGATFCPLLRAFLILFCQLVLPNSVDMFSRFTSMLHHAVEAVSIFLGLAVPPQVGPMGS